MSLYHFFLSRFLSLKHGNMIFSHLILSFSLSVSNHGSGRKEPEKEVPILHGKGLSDLAEICNQEHAHQSDLQPKVLMGFSFVVHSGRDRCQYIHHPKNQM